MRSVKTSTYSNTTQMAIQNYQLAFIDVAAPEGSGMTVCRREWSLQNVWNYPTSRHPPARHRGLKMTQSGPPSSELTFLKFIHRGPKRRTHFLRLEWFA